MADSFVNDTGLGRIWGKIKEALAGKAPLSHTHTKNQITDFPTSMPASDVYSWAKAESKPSYSWSEITDKPSTFTPASHTQGEATLTWGGGNFEDSYGPVDGSMIPELGANRLAFGNPAGITIEYSRDGGSTWTDYGESDYRKVNLFSPPGASFSIGKSDSNNKATADYLLRVTINTGSFHVYTQLNKFMIYCETNGSTGCYCSIDAALERTPTNFVNFANKVDISGWSGYNIINTSSITTYGNAPSIQYGRLRFTFGCTGGSTRYSGLMILKIYGFGGVGWTAPSNLAKTGHIYSIGSGQSVGFPGTVSADGGFTGNLTGTASNATNDSDGQQITTTYIKGLSVSGKTITYTKGDGSTGNVNLTIVDDYQQKIICESILSANHIYTINSMNVSELKMLDIKLNKNNSGFNCQIIIPSGGTYLISFTSSISISLDSHSSRNHDTVVAGGTKLEANDAGSLKLSGFIYRIS